MTHNAKLSALAIAAALACSPALAQDGPTVSFSGFGTLGAVHNNNDQADFVSNARQPNGAGATRSTSFAPDSLLAVQANVKFNPKLSAVVQVVSQHQYDNSFTPAIEWAFLKYQATPNLDFTIGRSALPVFAVSDSRLLGYSNLLVRPATDVYHQVPLTSVDGIGASWRHDIALGQLTLDAKYGKTDIKFPNGDRVKGDQLANVSATLESGPFVWRAGYTTTQLTYSADGLDALVGGFNQYGAGLAAAGAPAMFSQEAFAAGRELAIDKRRSSFVDLGVAYDKGNWLAQAEFTVRKSGSAISDTRAWHASTGYRVGKFTPYVGLSGLKTTSSTTDAPRVSTITPTALALNDGSAFVIGASGIASNTATVGVKWNFHKNMDLKVQYDDVRFKQGTAGTFIGLAPITQKRAGLTSVAVDFVF